MKKLRIIFLAATICAVGTLSAIAQSKSGESSNYKGNSSAVISGSINCTFDTSSGFSITDQNGCVWNSSILENEYDFSTLNDSWKQNIRSFLTIYYADISDVNPSVKTAFSTDATLTAEQENDGLSIKVAYPCGIELTVEAYVKDNRLQFNLPAKKIRETGKFKLISVDFMPYMGASGVDETGFMLYPDGCGALTYFNSDASEAIKNQTYTWDIYGTDFDNLDTLTQRENDELRTAMLPMFGISRHNGGFICFSEAGEAESKLQMTPANSGIALNRIYFSFQYRTSYQIPMSNIDINGTNTAKDINGKMIDSEMFKQDHIVSYAFLDKNQCDYSDMANAYRSFLKDNGRLKNSDKNSDYTVSISLLMSAAQESLFRSSLAVATDYKQAKTIIDYFDKIGCPNVLYTLKGWSNGGADSFPQSLKTAGQLGSGSDLSALLDCGKVSLTFNGFRAKGNQKGFSTGKDVIKNGNQNAVTDTAENQFLLNSNYFIRNWELLRKRYTENGKATFSLDDAGRLCYRDSSQENSMSREEMKAIVEEQLRIFSSQGRVNTEGANAYCLPYVDGIYGLEDDSSEYYISDKTVPLVQMVLHGSIVYTGKAGNLSSDFDKCLLKWLEYGYTPHFEFTYTGADVLKNTNQSTLFTSQYETHAELLKKAYKAYEQLEFLRTKSIVRHQTLSKTLSAVTFEGGTTVYCNYSDEPVVIEGLEIPAVGYAVKEGVE